MPTGCGERLPTHTHWRTAQNQLITTFTARPTFTFPKYSTSIVVYTLKFSHNEWTHTNVTVGSQKKGVYISCVLIDNSFCPMEPKLHVHTLTQTHTPNTDLNTLCCLNLRHVYPLLSVFTINYNNPYNDMSSPSVTNNAYFNLFHTIPPVPGGKTRHLQETTSKES